MHGTLFYGGGQTARISVNWSDESYRKMTTRITAWGTAGRAIPATVPAPKARSSSDDRVLTGHLLDAFVQVLQLLGELLDLLQR